MSRRNSHADLTALLSSTFPPPLADTTIRLGVQIGVVYKTHSIFDNRFDLETLRRLDFVIQQVISGRYKLRWSKGDTITSSFTKFIGPIERLIPATEQLNEPVYYPANWLVDHGTLNKAVQHFLQSTDFLGENSYYIKTVAELHNTTPLGYHFPTTRTFGTDNFRSRSRSIEAPVARQLQSDLELNLPDISVLPDDSELQEDDADQDDTGLQDTEAIFAIMGPPATRPATARDKQPQTTNTRSQAADPLQMQTSISNQSTEDQFLSRLDQILARLDKQDQRIQNIEAAAAPQQGPTGSSAHNRQNTNQPPLETQGNDHSTISVKAPWKQDELGYFYPDLSNRDCTGQGSVVNIGTQTCYRDVQLFVENLRSTSRFRGEDLVRSQLHNSLRGSALQWYIAELTEIEKDYLRRVDLETGWFAMLTKRFRQNPAQAMNVLDRLKYGPAEVLQGRTPVMFTQDVIRASIAVGLDSRHAQLLQAWNKLHHEYKLTVPMPQPFTEIAQWMKCMEDHYIVWREHAFAQRQEARVPQGGYSRRTNFSGYQAGSGDRPRAARPFYTGTPYNPPQRPPPLRERPYNQNAGVQASSSNEPYPYAPYKPEQPASRDALQRPPYASQNANRFPPRITSQPAYPQAANGRPKYGGRFNSYRRDQPQTAGMTPANRPQAYHADQGQTAGSSPLHEPHAPPTFDSNNNLAEAADDYAMGFHEGFDYASSQSPQTEDFDDTYDNMHDDHYADYAGYSEDYQPADGKAYHTRIEASFECDNCKVEFESNNKLHKHIQTCLTTGALPGEQPAENSVPNGETKTRAHFTAEVQATTNRRLIAPTEDFLSSRPLGHVFRGWHFATALASLSETADRINICVDSGCTLTVVDRTFLKSQCPEIEISTIENAVTVSGIGKDAHKTRDIVRLKVHMDATVQDEDVTVAVPCEAYVVNDLRANMLVGIDTLSMNRIDLMLASAQPHMRIRTCENAEVTLRVKVKEGNQRLTVKPVFSKEHTIVPANGSIAVPVHFKGSLDKNLDYIFQPCYSRVNLSAHIVDHQLDWIVAYNTTNRDWAIPRRTRLGTISDYEGTEAYQVSSMADILAQDFASRIVNNISTPRPIADKSRVLPNGITIYDDGSGEADLIEDTVMSFDVWRDKGFADVPEEQWMPIPMKEGWHNIVDQSGRVYSASAKDKKKIDETHDLLHSQDRMGFVRARPQPVFQSS